MYNVSVIKIKYVIDVNWIKASHEETFFIGIKDKFATLNRN